jgi:hypothetical protein
MQPALRCIHPAVGAGLLLVVRAAKLHIKD